MNATRPILADRIEATISAASQLEGDYIMSKPSHIAYVVVQPPEGSDKKAAWHPVGAVWPHSKGNGFDLVIPPGVTLSGRITCTERKEKAEEEQAA